MHDDDGGDDGSGGWRKLRNDGNASILAVSDSSRVFRY